MKPLTAFTYERKSNQEQSNWSIPGQRDTNQIYAQRREIEILGDYFDDGYTASNFDRPGWKRMVRDIKRYKPDLVLVSRYNRIARRAGLGISTLENLEQKHGVIFVSVEEMPSVDIHSAVFYKFRNDLLNTADFEWRQSRDASKHGTWSARKLGRFIGRAPWGMINIRDAENKPDVTYDESKLPILKLVGHLHHELGLPDSEVSRQAKAAGWDQTGKSALQRMLDNPAYYGLNSVPPYKQFPAEIVKARCPGIWPEKWYWQRMAKKESKQVKVRKAFSEEFYLRPLVLCECCEKPLTAAGSVGNGGRIGYYKCNRCNGQNAPAIRLHGWLDNILAAYTFDPNTIARLQRMTEVELAQKRERDEVERGRVQKEIALLEQKLETIEEKFLTSDKVNELTFAKWTAKYERNLNGAKYKLAELSKKEEAVQAEVLRVFQSLTDLRDPFYRLNVPNRQRMLQLMFGRMVVTKKGYRTDKIPLYFDDKPLSLKELESPSVGGKAMIPDFTPASARNGATIEPLLTLGRFLQTA